MSQTVTDQRDPEQIRALMERVRNRDVAAFRELFGAQVDNIHLALCKTLTRQELVHPLERQIFIDMWDRRIELIEGIDLDLWTQRRTLASIKQHYLRGRRMSVRQRLRFTQNLEETLRSAMDGQLAPDECAVELELRRSLWTEIQAYIETQPEGAEPWNFKGVALWMAMMALLFVGFIYASFNFSFDLTPPDPSQTAPESQAVPVSGEAPIAAIHREVPASAQVAAPDSNGQDVNDSELLLLQQEYAALKDEIIQNIDVDESVHDSELQETVEEELDLIEQSISEMVGLLGDDPENQFLEDMLIKTYQKQVKLLKKVTFLND